MGVCGVCAVPVSRNEDRCEDHLDTPAPEAMTEPDMRTDEEKARGVHPARAANRFVVERFEPWTAFRSDRHPCRVHVAAPAEVHNPHMGEPRVQAFCGIGAYSTSNGPKVAVDPAVALAEGETWCGRCLGPAIEVLGGRNRLAALFLTCLLEAHVPTGGTT